MEQIEANLMILLNVNFMHILELCIGFLDMFMPNIKFGPSLRRKMDCSSPHYMSRTQGQPTHKACVKT